MYHPRIMTERARALRQKATEAEKALWQRLRNRKCGGLKFKRQHPIGHYIVDFYCAELRLVIEVDGGIHDLPDRQACDAARTEQLESLGLTVLRITNEQILSDMEAALARIGRRASIGTASD